MPGRFLCPVAYPLRVLVDAILVSAGSSVGEETRAILVRNRDAEDVDLVDAIRVIVRALRRDASVGSQRALALLARAADAERDDTPSRRDGVRR